MAKAIKTIGTVVGTIATIASFIPGPHQPAAIAVSRIAAVAVTAATVAQQITAKPPPARGSLSQIIIESDASQPYLMGAGYFPGVVRHDTGYGATLDDVPNPYRFFPVVYSGGGPVKSIEPRFDFDAIPSWYNGFLFTDTQLGATPEADALAPEWAGAPGWGANSKLSGLAAIGWSALFDKEGKRFAGVDVRSSSGAYGEWTLVYDPRQDDTQPGGVGPCRLGDESTYVWDGPAGDAIPAGKNPALHAGTYAYGRYQNGKRVLGMGLPADGINWATVAAWANTCSANGWGSFFGFAFEPGDRWANLKDICFAGGAEPVAGGTLTFKYSAPVVALDTITVDDLTDDQRSITGMQPFRDRINTVIPKYRSPNHNWEMVDAEPVVNATFLTEDGEEKREVWPFNFVTGVGQASELAAYRMFDSRELPFTVTCKPHMRFYRPGECLHIQDEELGLDITAIILRRQINPVTMKVTFEMITETAAKHAYCLGQTGVAPPTPAVGQTAQERDELAAAANGDATPQIVGPTSKVVEAKTNGAAVDGELPFTTNFSLLYRGTDRTADAAWSVAVDSGTITLSIGASTGQVTVTAMDSLLASYTVTAVIDGRETKFVHQVAKRLAGVDINTGTGGSSSADNSFNSFAATTYSVVTDVMNMQTGTAGEVDLSAPLTLKVGSGAPTGSYSATLQWEQDIGGTWTAVGSAHATGNSLRENDGTVIPASASANETLTGLTASTAYNFRLTAKANEADGITRFLSGTASATGS